MEEGGVAGRITSYRAVAPFCHELMFRMAAQGFRDISCWPAAAAAATWRAALRLYQANAHVRVALNPGPFLRGNPPF